jgi:hypothetical protein
MGERKNSGYDPQVIAEFRNKLTRSGKVYLTTNEDENSEECIHFQFIGRDRGREVIFDTVMYTLRMQHESELFEEAEHRAAKHFPNYKKITYEEDENGNLELLDSDEEAIGLFMAEVILELEDEEAIKVKEHVDTDYRVDFGIALDVGLHVSEITEEVIARFIHEFNQGTLRLDPTLYSFQTQQEVP